MGAEIANRLLNDLPQQLILTADVVVKASRQQTRGFGDVPQRGSIVAFLAKDLRCGLEDLLLLGACLPSCLRPALARRCAPFHPVHPLSGTYRLLSNESNV